jgi:uridine kinase
MDTILIGIAGGSGSGKTTLANKLIDCFGSDEVSILRHDNYYKRHDEIPFEERARLNYDHPDSFDTKLLCQHIRMLKQGQPIRMPLYDYSQHNRSDQVVVVQPAPVIILEGIMIFADQELCDLLDIKVFVDTDADVRILRRIMRDVKERGRSLDSVISQYLTTVKPMHEQFVEPSKRKADIIIPEGGKNQVALDMLIQRIKYQLRHNRRMQADGKQTEENKKEEA